MAVRRRTQSSAGLAVFFAVIRRETAGYRLGRIRTFNLLIQSYPQYRRSSFRIGLLRLISELRDGAASEPMTQELAQDLRVARLTRHSDVTPGRGIPIAIECAHRGRGMSSFTTR